MKELFLKLYKDRKAVSAVVGVILMVAATIVIAAIVMGFLGGFKAPQRPLDIQLGNAQAYYNNSSWVVSFTIAGSEANVLSKNNIEFTVINTTGVDLSGTVSNVSLVDHSVLEIIGNNTRDNHNHYYVNDNHPKLKVIVKYKPTGQILFDNIIIAYNATS